MFAIDAAWVRELERICSSLPPAPWVSLVEGRDHTTFGSAIARALVDDIAIAGLPVDDQDFIASARSLLPKLIADYLRVRSGEPAMMSREALASVLGTCELLTPEPWEALTARGSRDRATRMQLLIPEGPPYMVLGASPADLEFIVAARGAVPALARYLKDAAAPASHRRSRVEIKIPGGIADVTHLVGRTRQ